MLLVAKFNHQERALSRTRATAIIISHHESECRCYLKLGYFPEHITGLVDYVRRDCDSPGPPADYVGQDRNLEHLEMGALDVNVQTYFQNEVFPRPTDILTRTEKLPMVKHAVPNVSTEFKVSTSTPAMLYGYDRNGTFPQQQAQLRSMKDEVLANNHGTLYPFFVIEFTAADGPSGAGNLSVATNQCLSSSASCVNMAECLNDRLRRRKSGEILPIDSAAFSIAMSGTEARLYITSWKHDELNYYMQNVRCFLLQDPNHYLKFRKYVRNIIDWGKDKRLEEIRDSLVSLLKNKQEENL